MRYAGQSPRVALRERFDGVGRIICAEDEQLRLVQLTGSLRVLDLRREVNLDALGLDDQISTARAPAVWRASQRLADVVDDWFGERCHGIVYRSRTTPERSANLAFGRGAPLTARVVGRLGNLHTLLVAAVVSDGFTIESW